MLTRTLASLLCASLLAAPLCAGDDWPLFRQGDLQTGVATGSLPDKLEVLWKFTAKDSIESAPAIVGETVYLASADEHLYAIGLADGKEKWKYKAGGSFKSSPAVRNGLVYVGDQEGVFHCIDAEKGSKKWSFATGAEIDSSANFAGDKVLVGSYDENLYCFEAATGKVVWKFKTQGPVNCAPAIVEE